jgi:hypothetical protein
MLRSAVVLLRFYRGDWAGLDGEITSLSAAQSTLRRSRVDIDLVAGCLALAHGDVDQALQRLEEVGPAAGLALLAQARAGGALDDNPLAVAAQADLTARRGDRDHAAALFRQAAALAHVESERAHCSTAPANSLHNPQYQPSTCASPIAAAQPSVLSQ